MAGALSNGHRKTAERNEKKTFVFGSSTPRDLSYMYSVPAMLRAYDSKIKPIKRTKDQTLSHYMRQARSVTRNQSGSREGSRDRVMRGTFAFGSSTPRILSHLCSTAREYSDNRINPQVGRRSYTTPTFPTPRSKTAGASMNVQMKRTDGITQKPSGTVTSKGTCRVMSTSYQSKAGSEEFMNSVKKKLEARSDKTKAMKKVVNEGKQSKNEKAGGRKTSVAKTEFSEVSGKLSPASVEFGNENKKVLIVEEPKLEATIATERQLLTASIVEDEVRLLPVGSTPVEKITAEEVAENKSITKTSRLDSLIEDGTVQILHEGSEEGEIDVSIQPRSIEQDNLTNKFSIISKKDHVETDASNSEHKDETGREFTINSGYGKREPSIGLYSAAMTIDSGTFPTKLSSSSVPDKTLILPSGNNELKDEHSPKSSEDKVKDRKTVVETSNNEQINPELEQSKLPEIIESIPESLHQLQGSDCAAFDMQSEHANVEHKIIYNHSYYPETPVPQECNTTSERGSSFHEYEIRKSKDINKNISAL